MEGRNRKLLSSPTLEWIVLSKLMAFKIKIYLVLNTTLILKQLNNPPAK